MQQLDIAVARGVGHARGGRSRVAPDPDLDNQTVACCHVRGGCHGQAGRSAGVPTRLLHERRLRAPGAGGICSLTDPERRDHAQGQQHHPSSQPTISQRPPISQRHPSPRGRMRTHCRSNQRAGVAKSFAYLSVARPYSEKEENVFRANESNFRRVESSTTEPSEIDFSGLQALPRAVICARLPALNFMGGSQRLFEIGVAIVGSWWEARMLGRRYEWRDTTQG